MFKGTKKHDYLICIDSDGTIMDTMTIKHERCFGPSFIEIFDIKENVEDILNHWNDVNLYTLTRGINRFQGLKEILEYVDKKYQIKFLGSEEFYNWVDTTKAFSVDLLKEEISKNSNNAVLIKALEWSNLVNENIKKLPPSKMFENVKESLNLLASNADLLGVSSANKGAVYKEWQDEGIFEYFLDVACQDVGTKSDIIKAGISLGYKKDKVIMIGDASGDLNAAKENDCLFFPIIPKFENETWEYIKNQGYKMILEGKYTKEVQDEYINKFFEILNKGE